MEAYVFPPDGFPDCCIPNSVSPVDDLGPRVGSRTCGFAGSVGDGQSVRGSVGSGRRFWSASSGARLLPVRERIIRDQCGCTGGRAFRGGYGGRRVVGGCCVGGGGVGWRGGGRLRGRPRGVRVLAGPGSSASGCGSVWPGGVGRFRERGDVWEARLVRALRQSNADQDSEALALAGRLVSLVDPAGVAEGRYVVDARDAKGVQVGDRNVQVNRF